MTILYIKEPQINGNILLSMMKKQGLIVKVLENLDFNAILSEITLKMYRICILHVYCLNKDFLNLLRLMAINNSSCFF